MSKQIVHIVVNQYTHDARVIRECKSLAKEGYDVTVLAYWLKGLDLAHRENGYNVVRIRIYTKSWSSHPMAQIIKYIEFLIKSLMIIRKIKPNTCHCHNPDGLLIGYIAKLFWKTKLIYDSHELWAHSSHMTNYNRILYKIGRWFEKALINKSDAVITVCDSILKVIKSENSVSEISVVRNMPELSTDNYNYSRDSLQFPKCKNILIYSGHIIPGRGINNIIKAMRSVNDDIGLVIMGGNGHYKNTMIANVEKYKLTMRVAFVGAVTPERVISICKLADVGIVPIRNICDSYYLCLPNKLFEYIQSGLPVLCSDFPEMKNIIKQYHVGLTFNPEDPIQIAAKINEILFNEAKYYDYCGASIKAAKILNWDIEKKNLFSVYRQL